MPRIFNTDDPADLSQLVQIAGGSGYAGVRPREKRYGDIPGVDAIDDVPDALLQPDQYRDALREAHDKKQLPIYHMRHAWSPTGYRWNQSSLRYCWTWGGTACLMTIEAYEEKPFEPLAPVSMGYLVGWSNRGNYLEDFVRGAQIDGIAVAPDGNMNSTNRSGQYWSQHKATRQRHRLGRCWDTHKPQMKQHCLSGLVYGASGFIAYNWWGHALMLASIRIGDDGTWFWDIRNSHNEPDVITLTGSKAVPDECLLFVSTTS